MEKDPQILGIALVICKNPIDGKYLGVLETNKTWWVPGGRVDAPQSFTTGAIRECQEEAGIDVEIKGVLRIQQSPSYGFARLKIVYYAEPKDPFQKPKNKPDKESLEAAYLTLEEILNLKSVWRGPQLYAWASYLHQGGRIYPLSILQESQI